MYASSVKLGWLAILACACAAGLGAAQSPTTISLFIPDTDSQSIVASVVAADTIATTYVLNCPPAADPNDCGLGPGLTLVEGPSTLLFTLSNGGATESIGCVLMGTTAAVCTMSLGGNAIGSVAEIETSTLGESDITYFPVVVTAGQELLASAPGATTAAGAANTATDSNTLFTVVGGAMSTLAASTGGGTSGSQGTAGATTTTSSEGGSSNTASAAGTSKSTGAAVSGCSVGGMAVAAVLLGIAAL